ncbi:MAG TPA: FAD-dependent oxidoreductase, partial [Microbacterium sp.]|nr:FAD-dependent oxidoreductase [Microbacterium sp.]
MRGHALIIGAGIAGLTAGHALLQAGWSVEIRERSARPPTTGTALGMWPEAMRALDSIGFGDRIRARSIHQAGGAILRADGRMITRLTPNLSAHLVTRPVLLETLAGALPPAN